MSASNSALVRDFYDEYTSEKPEVPTSLSNPKAENPLEKQRLLEYIWSNVIGSRDLIASPFGVRKITYADYTASGRGLSFIENYIQQEVLPLYANTHTTSDTTGLQTTLFRHEARDIVRRGCRGSNVEDAVLFTGSGSTSGFSSVIQILKLKETVDKAIVEKTALPIVLIGPMEHHSNILPWRETGAIVISLAHCQFKSQSRVPSVDINILVDEALKKHGKLHNTCTSCDSDSIVSESDSFVTIDDSNQSSGVISQAHLTHVLSLIKSYNSPLIIGSFSAGSNVTGALEDTLAVTALLHDYNALSVWDYAACAPYVSIDMNPLNSDCFKKDVVVLSTHKFVGGVSTPGVVCIKKRLLQTNTPHRPGGGTVLFVSEKDHTYLANFEEKEEGGTPDIVGSIKAGLVFALKESVGVDFLASREEKLMKMALLSLSSHPLIEVLGSKRHINHNDNSPSASFNYKHQIPIISFAVRYANDPSLLLHHNFIAAILNDLFGIQARSGCACAGPYVQSLMGIDATTTSKFLDCIYEKQEIVRPGMLRVNLPYFSPLFEIEFILKAIQWVATHAWKLLPYYTFVVASGEFKHISKKTKTPGRRWLGGIRFNGDGMTYENERKVLAVDGGVVGYEGLNDGDKASSQIQSLLLAKYLHDADYLVSQLNTNTNDHSYSHINAKTPANLSQCLRDRELLTVSYTNTENALKGFIDASLVTVDGERTYMQDMLPVFTPSSSPSTAAFTAVVPLSTLPSALPDQQMLLTVRAQQMRWFVMPSEALADLKAITQTQIHTHTSTDVVVTVPALAPVVLAHSRLLNRIQSSVMPHVPYSCNVGLQTRDVEKLMQWIATEETCRITHTNVREDNTDKDQVSPSTVLTTPSTVVKSPSTDLMCQNCFHEHKAPSSDLSSVHSRECSTCECVHFTPRHAGSKKEILNLTKKMASLVGSAILTYNMIKEGDRIMVGVSGGKDSLTLIHILLYLQRRSPVKFHIGAATVDPQAPEYDPSLLKRYFASLGVPYFYESQAIMETAKKCLGDDPKASICAFCSRMRRGILYSTCRREKYNVLALGQHLDDLSESFVMSAFHNGLLRTMKVNYLNASGDVRIIRPLCHVRESKTREFAKVMDLPIISENCPACFEAPKERQRVKLMLAAQENVHPNLHQTLLRTMTPLMKLSNTGNVRDAFDELVQNIGEDDDEVIVEKKGKKRMNNNKKVHDDATNTNTAPAVAPAVAEVPVMESSAESEYTVYV